MYTVYFLMKYTLHDDDNNKFIQKF